MNEQTSAAAETVVKRRIAIRMPPDDTSDIDGSRPLLEQAIDAAWNARKGTVEVTYDALETDFDTLVDALDAAGWKVSRGRWSRCKAVLYRFMDRNLRDNAKHRPACCSKPPPGASR